MPFICEIRLEPEQLEHGPLVFDAWIDDAWDRYVPAGTAFAHVHDTQGACLMVLSGPGVLLTKSKFKKGDLIDDTTLIAHYQTDGEDIVYGEPACRIERC